MLELIGEKTLGACHFHREQISIFDMMCENKMPCANRHTFVVLVILVHVTCYFQHDMAIQKIDIHL